MFTLSTDVGTRFFFFFLKLKKKHAMTIIWRRDPKCQVKTEVELKAMTPSVTCFQPQFPDVLYVSETEAAPANTLRFGAFDPIIKLVFSHRFSSERGQICVSLKQFPTSCSSSWDHLLCH